MIIYLHLRLLVYAGGRNTMELIIKFWKHSIDLQ